MSISFDENEQILFKNKATYNSKQGEIVVTSLRFAWVSGNVTDQEFQTPWANIQNIKYSPADDPKERVMAMIQMVAGTSCDKPPVFHLTGPTKQICRIELERLKSTVAAVRKGKEASEAKEPEKSSTGAEHSSQGREKKRSRTQITIDKNSTDYKDTVALTEKRKDLLAADKLLGKQYRELVEVSRLLSHEDFWDNYASQHQQFLPEKNRKGSSFDQKGQLSVMLMDIEGSKNADGSHRIDLTKEKRDQIFLMYPAVRKAFEAEVPLNKTETDFWVAYFQSEYFARDKGGRAGGDDELYGRTDDMFLRYEERPADSERVRSAPSSSSSQSKTLKKNLTGLVGSDVDLTAILGDFGPSDAMNLEIGSGLSKNKAIVDKYNRFSQMFTGAKGVDKLGAGAVGEVDTRKARRATELSELNKEPEPAYLPLHLGSLKEQVAGEIKEEEEGSAFAKSAFAVKKSNRVAPPQRLAVSAEDLLSTLHSAFPTPQKALSCFLSDLKNLDALSAVAQKAAVSAGESVGARAVVGQQSQDKEVRPSSNFVAGLPGGIKGAGSRLVKQESVPLLGPSAGTVMNLTGASSRSGGQPGDDVPGVSEGSELSESFRQEMMEQFTLVTEFSRHFYAMLNREGEGAPLPHTPSAEKVAKIIARLTDYGENLTRKKNNLLSQDRDASGKGAHRRIASSVTVITEILRLIARANNKWDTFQKTTVGLNQ